MEAGSSRIEPADFDLAAALSRRADGDARAFVEALAARLGPALPGRVEVERRRDGLFSASSHVASIAVRFDDAMLTLAFARGRLSAHRAKVVRGVTISTQEVPVPEWLADLVRRARALGEEAAAAHAALGGFLLS